MHYPHFTDEETTAGEGKPRVTQLTQNSNLCHYDVQVQVPDPEHDCQEYSASLSPGERSSLLPESSALGGAAVALPQLGAGPAVACLLLPDPDSHVQPWLHGETLSP